jgi:hypothetical protein
MDLILKIRGFRQSVLVCRYVWIAVEAVIWRLHAELVGVASEFVPYIDCLSERGTSTYILGLRS